MSHTHKLFNFIDLIKRMCALYFYFWLFPHQIIYLPLCTRSSDTLVIKLKPTTQPGVDIYLAIHNVISSKLLTSFFLNTHHTARFLQIIEEEVAKKTSSSNYVCTFANSHSSIIYGTVPINSGTINILKICSLYTMIIIIINFFHIRV